MELICLTLLSLTLWRLVSPGTRLYSFSTKATLPLRGILALFIMLHHIALNYDFSFGIPFLKQHPYLSLNLFYNTGQTVTGIFFFLTGYGLAKSLIAKREGYIDGFLKKRSVSILPEFLFLSLIVTVFLVFFKGASVQGLLMEFLRGMPPLPNSWFVYAILYVYFAFYISAICMHCRPFPTGVMLIALLVAYVFCVINFGWGKWWYMSIPSVMVGYFIAVYEERVDRILKSKLGLIGANLLCVC